MNERELQKVLESNSDIMLILGIINDLNLKDCWLCAGTIRNFIWDYLSDRQGTSFLSDIDVVFYDPTISYEETLMIEKNLIKEYPQFDWELKNQVYMHMHNPGTHVYTSTNDALSKFPETCTAIGVRLKNQEIELLCPYGISDLVHFYVRPTPFFSGNPERMKVYQQRIEEKKWQKRWPNLILK